MEVIPKFMASMFVIIIAVFVGMSLLVCGTSVESARTFHADAANAISAVDVVHEANAIEECKWLAEQQGYTLNVEKITTNGGSYYYELVLEYQFIAPFFGKPQSGTVSGYAYPGAHRQG